MNARRKGLERLGTCNSEHDNEVFWNVEECSIRAID